MPPSDFQARVLRVIAANRSPESHVGGGVALNYGSNRDTHDIDIFHDREGAVGEAAEADARSLAEAGFSIKWLRRHPSMITAVVTSGDEQTSLDWVQDSAVRFFPIQPHHDLGFVLHPFDLATNKALAAAGRREPRDVVDLIHLHETLYPLGAIVWAAVGKDEGYSPELLLNLIARQSRYSDDDLVRVDTVQPLTAADLSRRLKRAIADARAFIKAMPAETVGRVFLKDGRPVQPDPVMLADYGQSRATPGGVWPISPGL
jgi:hypothetical protein